MTSAASCQSWDQPTLFVVDSHAKTSALQANKQASSKALGLVSFTNSCESFAWFDRSSLSWKTWQRSLLTDWTPFSGSWPRQGLMRSGHVFQQVLWELATSVTDGGLLPTPVRPTGGRSVPKDAVRKGLSAYKDGKKMQVDLQNHLRWMLPTPRTCSAMAAPLNTPGNLLSDRNPNLETVMGRMLPTPTTNDSKNSSLPPSQINRDGLAGMMLRDDSIPTGEATYLNPSFVEEMMGFPVGWTA